MVFTTLSLSNLLSFLSHDSQVITACANAVISVWDLHTGRHVLEFQHYSSRTNFKDVPWASATKRLEVTAMTLDGSERCVVTGANDGTVNLWNFSSGVLLANYELPDNNLVSGLAVDRVGFNRAAGDLLADFTAIIFSFRFLCQHISES